MINKRIKYYEEENNRLFSLMVKYDIKKFNELIIKTINEHEAVIKELKYIKKLNMQSVVFSGAEFCQLKESEYERGVEDGKIIAEHGTVNWQT